MCVCMCVWGWGWSYLVGCCTCAVDMNNSNVVRWWWHNEPSDQQMDNQHGPDRLCEIILLFALSFERHFRISCCLVFRWNMWVQDYCAVVLDIWQQIIKPKTHSSWRLNLGLTVWLKRWNAITKSQHRHTSPMLKCHNLRGNNWISINNE